MEVMELAKPKGGRPKRVQPKEKMGVYICPDFFRKLKVEAAKSGSNLSQFVESALNKQFERPSAD
jgi:hypothetical protein